MELKVSEMDYLTQLKVSYPIGYTSQYRVISRLDFISSTFLAYINDLFNFSTDALMVLFADETTLIFQDKNYMDLIRKFNSVLNDFRQWTQANRLPINVDKTFPMLFPNRLNRRIFSWHHISEKKTIKLVY